MDFTKEQTKEIHHRIKRVIADKRMSMKDFYEKSGVSSSLFSQYNTGKSAMSLRMVSKIVSALGVSIDDLLDCIEKDEKNTRQHDTDGLSDAEKRIIDLMKNLTDYDLSVLEATAQALTQSRDHHRQGS